jgi:hypothetical protein
MSANNWAKCPRCAALATAKADAATDEAAEAYGRVSQAEYLALLEKSRQAAAQHPGALTFREDYEIRGADTGLITVSYGGGCDVCGLKVSFYHQHPIEGLA